MGIAYTVHKDMTSLWGQPHPFPVLPPVGGETLAVDTASAAIRGPCVLSIAADADHLIAIGPAAGELDTATATLLVPADQSRSFFLENGTWYIEAGAWPAP